LHVTRLLYVQATVIVWVGLKCKSRGMLADACHWVATPFMLDS
jgi:hypothetical protein